MPKDRLPVLPDGNVSQLLFADLVSVTAGVPVFAERVEDLPDVLPFCATEKLSDVGENDKAGATVTFSVTVKVALA